MTACFRFELESMVRIYEGDSTRVVEGSSRKKCMRKAKSGRLT